MISTLLIAATACFSATAFAQTGVDFGTPKVEASPSARVAPTGASSTLISGANDQIAQARLLEQILKAIMPGKQNVKFDGVAFAHGFTVRTCTIPPQSWAAFVLMGTPVSHTFQFKEGCDVDGTIKITKEPFPVDLKLRYLADIERVSMTDELVVKPVFAQAIVYVSWSAKDGKFFSKGSTEPLEFSADYKCTAGVEGTLVENTGGFIHVTKYKGKSNELKLTMPLKID